jgi:hypothetical protein
MKLKLVAVVFMAFCVFAVAGQSVTIVPKKQIYRRPKPLMDFKRTFSIRRPVAKASTPALSKKVTAAIDPDTVLNIRLKDELGGYQWLEEADYKVLYNKNFILSVEEWMEGTAAYPDSVAKHVVVNLQNGNRVRPGDVFSNLPGLATVLKRLQAAEVKESIAEMKKDPDLADSNPSELFSNTSFTAKNLSEFSVNGSGATFYYDYGFPHAIKATQPDGEYILSWTQLKPFIRRDGLLARFIR